MESTGTPCQHAWHVHGAVPRTWSCNKPSVAQRVKGRGWSRNGRTKKPSLPCLHKSFPWLTSAPLPFESIFLPFLADSNCASRWCPLPCKSHSVCSHTRLHLFCLDLLCHPWLDKCRVTYWQRILKIIELFTYLNTDRNLLISFDYL